MKVVPRIMLRRASRRARQLCRLSDSARQAQPNFGPGAQPCDRLGKVVVMAMQHIALSRVQGVSSARQPAGLPRLCRRSFSCRPLM